MRRHEGDELRDGHRLQRSPSETWRNSRDVTLARPRFRCRYRTRHTGVAQRFDGHFDAFGRDCLVGCGVQKVTAEADKQ